MGKNDIKKSLDALLLILFLSLHSFSQLESIEYSFAK